MLLAEPESPRKRSLLRGLSGFIAWPTLWFAPRDGLHPAALWSLQMQAEGLSFLLLTDVACLLHALTAVAEPVRLVAHGRFPLKQVQEQ